MIVADTCVTTYHTISTHDINWAFVSINRAMLWKTVCTGNSIPDFCLSWGSISKYKLYFSITNIHLHVPKLIQHMKVNVVFYFRRAYCQVSLSWRISRCLEMLSHPTLLVAHHSFVPQRWVPGKIQTGMDIFHERFFTRNSNFMEISFGCNNLWQEFPNSILLMPQQHCCCSLTVSQHGFS